MHARNSSEFLLALDSIQARSQVFFMGKCDPKRRRTKWGQRGKSLGGELWLSETELRGKFTIGGWGVDVERVNVCQLGLSGGMLPQPPPLPPTPYGLGNVLKMAIAIVVLLFICLIHYFSNFVIARFSAPTSSIWFPWSFVLYVIVTRYISYTDCAINPIVCFISSSNYRQVRKRLVNCCDTVQD